MLQLCRRRISEPPRHRRMSVGGVRMMLAWIWSGLPFDLMHAGGNFLLMLVLYSPRRKAREKIKAAGTIG